MQSAVKPQPRVQARPVVPAMERIAVRRAEEKPRRSANRKPAVNGQSAGARGQGPRRLIVGRRTRAATIIAPRPPRPASAAPAKVVAPVAVAPQSAAPKTRLTAMRSGGFGRFMKSVEEEILHPPPLVATDAKVASTPGEPLALAPSTTETGIVTPGGPVKVIA